MYFIPQTVKLIFRGLNINNKQCFTFTFMYLVLNIVMKKYGEMSMTFQKIGLNGCVKIVLKHCLCVKNIDLRKRSGRGYQLNNKFGTQIFQCYPPPPLIDVMSCRRRYLYQNETWLKKQTTIFEPLLNHSVFSVIGRVLPCESAMLAHEP